MLLGLRHLHDEVNIAHRDIKLENVVLACAGPFPKVQVRGARAPFFSLPALGIRTKIVCGRADAIIRGHS